MPPTHHAAITGPPESAVPPLRTYSSSRAADGRLSLEGQPDVDDVFSPSCGTSPVARRLEPIDTSTLAGRRDPRCCGSGSTPRCDAPSPSRSASRTSSSTPRSGRLVRPSSRGETGRAVWYDGGRLARDLTLPALPGYSPAEEHRGQRTCDPPRPCRRPVTRGDRADQAESSQQAMSGIHSTDHVRPGQLQRDGARLREGVARSHGSERNRARTEPLTITHNDTRSLPQRRVERAGCSTTNAGSPHAFWRT